MEIKEFERIVEIISENINRRMIGLMEKHIHCDDERSQYYIPIVAACIANQICMLAHIMDESKTKKGKNMNIDSIELLKQTIFGGIQKKEITTEPPTTLQ